MAREFSEKRTEIEYPVWANRKNNGRSVLASGPKAIGTNPVRNTRKVVARGGLHIALAIRNEHESAPGQATGASPK